MTPTPAETSSSTMGGGKPGVQLGFSLRLSQVLATVGFMPAALVGSLSERNFQLVDHHRRSVIKRYAGPGGLRAKRAIATRLFRYGSKPNPNSIEDVVGESFAAATQEESLFEKRSLVRLEEGGSYQAKEAMIIPIGAGAREIRGGVIPTKQFADALKAHRFRIINTARTRGLLVVDYARRGKVGERSVIMGKIIMGRTQRPLLNFYARFEDVKGKHLAAMEKDVELAMTAAGQAKLQTRLDDKAAERAAYKSALREVLNANPGAFAEAKKAARAAALAVRTGNKVGEGGTA